MSLSLKKNCFTVKNNGEVDFLRGTNGRRIGTVRKTNRAMPSETVVNGLKSYAIGAKLRRLRLRKSMGLIELGQHTGLSPALLSKLERDVMHPTLPTLLRIAMVFSVGLEYFFNPEPKPVVEVVRRKDRLRFPDTPGAESPAYWFESLDFPVPNRPIHTFVADFEGASAPHEHPGVELLYVLAGRLELTVAGAAHELGEGDAVYFDGAAPHAYRKLGARKTSALVVACAPPKLAGGI
jgi:transcriptional regulator with XRE-family HTH domain